MVWAATAVAGATLVSGYMGSQAQKKAAGQAADAQVYAADQAAEVQREAMAQIQENLKPYMDQGGPALQQLSAYASSTVPAQGMQQDILGMNGPEAQQAAISRIESDPLFQSSIRSAEDAMLQNASATGGLRGGNTQAALAQLRPAMLRSEIDKQYDLLGGQAGAGLGLFGDLAKLGQAAGAQQALSAQTGAANIGNLLTNAGNANAQAALSRGQATQNMWGNIAGATGQFVGLGGLNSIFGTNPATSGVPNLNTGLGTYGSGFGSALPAGTSASQNLTAWGQ